MRLIDILAYPNASLLSHSYSPLSFLPFSLVFEADAERADLTTCTWRLKLHTRERPFPRFLEPCRISHIANWKSHVRSTVSHAGN